MVIWITYYRAFFPGFFWPFTLLCLTESVFGLSQCVCTHHISLPKWILVKRPMGTLTSPVMGWYPSPSLLPLKRLSVHVWLGRCPWPWEWGIWSLFLWAGPSFSLLLLSSPWNVCPQGTNSTWSAWDLSISCLRKSSPHLELKSSFPICAVNSCANVLACMHSRFSCAWLSVTMWTIAHQVPLSMGFSRREYWRGLPCPPPGDLPNPGMEPVSLTSPALTGGSFTTSATWEAPLCWCCPPKPRQAGHPLHLCPASASQQSTSQSCPLACLILRASWKKAGGSSSPRASDNRVEAWGAACACGRGCECGLYSLAAGVTPQPFLAVCL